MVQQSVAMKEQLISKFEKNNLFLGKEIYFYCPNGKSDICRIEVTMA